jgi:hypothetical protein
VSHNHKNRLRKAEAQAAPVKSGAQESVFDRIRAYAAWFAGTGPWPPDPPCPAGYDPDAWSSRMRLKTAWALVTRGDLAPGEYPPGLTDEERREVDGYRAEIEAGRARAQADQENEEEG